MNREKYSKPTWEAYIPLAMAGVSLGISTLMLMHMRNVDEDMAQYEREMATTFSSMAGTMSTIDAAKAKEFRQFSSQDAAFAEEDSDRAQIEGIISGATAAATILSIGAAATLFTISLRARKQDELELEEIQAV